jgi:hypothetical protein
MTQIPSVCPGECHLSASDPRGGRASTNAGLLGLTDESDREIGGVTKSAAVSSQVIDTLDVDTEPNGDGDQILTLVMRNAVTMWTEVIAEVAIIPSSAARSRYLTGASICGAVARHRMRNLRTDLALNGGGDNERFSSCFLVRFLEILDFILRGILKFALKDYTFSKL